MSRDFGAVASMEVRPENDDVTPLGRASTAPSDATAAAIRRSPHPGQSANGTDQ